MRRCCRHRNQQRVHDRDGARTHGQDVAHDAADTRCCTLIRLNERRMVVRLDFEGDGVALTDVDDTGVLAHANEERTRLRRFLSNWRRCTLLLLYEQCSLHMTE